MRLTFRKVAYVVLGLYFLITCYTGFLVIKRRAYTFSIRDKERHLLDKFKTLSEITDDVEWNPWGEEFEEEGAILQHHVAPQILWGAERPLAQRSPLVSADNASTEDFVVEVWGKAAIGLYLWEHIFNAELDHRMGGVWSYGTKKIGSITFRFRTGPGVVPRKVPKESENVLLVLNGREASKVEFARTWLDFLPALPRLRSAAVLLLGNEQCRNDWIKPYLTSRGGPLRHVFLVYDSADIDNANFYQWPLGVATYRNFPKVAGAGVPMSTRRKYMCSFLGTLYHNSSRQLLLDVLERSPFKRSCYIKPRLEWQPQETVETRNDYLQALAQSDLTLNPVGQNTECYRIYEAMAYGSVPVVEDVMTPGDCGSSPASNVYPLRILKELNAPVIYIKDWQTLPELLKQEASLSDHDKAKRREDLLLWYENFKMSMREKMVRILEEKFFNIRLKPLER